MSNSEKITILKDFLGGYNKSGGEYLFTCPKCNHHKRKLSVNIDKNVFKCWICEYSGTNIGRLVRKHADFNLRAKWKEITGQYEIEQFDEIIASLFPEQEEEIEEVVKLPNEFLSLANKSKSLLSRKARNYLKASITDEDILFGKSGIALVANTLAGLSSLLSMRTATVTILLVELTRMIGASTEPANCKKQNYI